MSYKVILKPSAAKQIQRIEKKFQKKIISAAKKLVDDPRPHGYKKLVDEEGLYRFRVGIYRIIYEIYDADLIVNILQVKKRNERTY
ncbi:hypothetical protein BH20ACI1_BH20ACI1_06850 [soil metagenome]